MTTSKGQQKRNFILDKAQEIFLMKGYAATSMEDLVQHIGVSKGSIYYYFDSKEMLFIKLVERKSFNWMDTWKRKESGYSTVTEKLYGVAEHYVLDSQNPLVKVAEDFYLSQSDRNEEIMNHLLELIRAPRAIYSQIFREAEQSGVIEKCDTEELAIIFSGLLDGLSTTYYESSEEEMKSIYKKAVTYFLHGVLKK